jgi:hypothetical protein
VGYKRVKGGRAGAGRGIAVTVTIIRFWIVPPLGPCSNRNREQPHLKVQKLWIRVRVRVLMIDTTPQLLIWKPHSNIWPASGLVDTRLS